MIHPLLVTDQSGQSIQIRPGVKIGHFVAAIIKLLVIDLVTFVLIGIIHKLKKSEEKSAAQTPTLTEKLLMEIRDVLKK